MKDRHRVIRLRRYRDRVAAQREAEVGRVCYCRAAQPSAAVPQHVDGIIARENEGLRARVHLERERRAPVEPRCVAYGKLADPPQLDARCVRSRSIALLKRDAARCERQAPNWILRVGWRDEVYVKPRLARFGIEANLADFRVQDKARYGNPLVIPYPIARNSAT